jgi:predicted Zn-dependent peptidase
MTEQETLNQCLTAFEKETSAKKIKKAINCNLNLLYLAKENYRGRKELFYQSLSEDVRMVRNYLLCLSELELYSFTEDEIAVFSY